MAGLIEHDLFIRLYRARDLMRERYHERLTLEAVASEAFMSPFHFHRLFAAAFDESPHQFLTRIRLEEAKSLLRRSGTDVTDVCFSVGYQSLGSFSSLFSRSEGCSPREFRKVYAIPGAYVLKAMPACMLSIHRANSNIREA